MEERLDDAIHVLRTHAEGSLPPGMSPVVAGSLLSAAAAAAAAAGASGGVQPVGYSTSVGSSVASAVQPMDQMVSQVFCNALLINKAFTSFQVFDCLTLVKFLLKPESHPS